MKTQPDPVVVRYISSACNNTPHSLDWNSSGLVAYAAYCNVVIYDPQNGEGGKVLHTLTNHKAKVMAVKWVLNTLGEPQYEDLISCSLDKTAILWKHVSDGDYLPYHMRGHTDTVEHTDAVRYQQKDDTFTLIATTSADSSVKLWIQTKNTGEIQCIQTLNISSKAYDLHILCVRLVILPSSNQALVLCSADDCNVYVYVLDLLSHQLTQSSIKLKGHENWIRSLDITFEDDKVYIASGSQDNTIRIWALCPKPAPHEEGEFQTEQQILELGGEGGKLYVTLESVLLGHEGWVYGVHWHPTLSDGTRPLHLLSCSMDKSIIAWAPDLSTGLWLESARVGEVGGNTLGFYGCKFGPQGRYILGHGFQGSLHLWKLKGDIWQPCVTVGGHFGSVRDIRWEPSGQFIISVSEDQTTRLHAPFVGKNTWHEMARPQVHGYDLTCLALVSTFLFASGADEKVVRVFRTTQNFVDNIQRMCGVDFSEHDFVKNELHQCPVGAQVPALGLSNMAVEEENQELTAQNPSQVFHLEHPPTEEDLVQNTLWPEIQKLYGHGYEIYSLAASHDGKLLASACKATKPEHAAVIIWDVSTWKQVQSLPCHQLTITQLCFSPDDTRLVSVSRDRRWGLYQRDSTGRLSLVACTDKTNGVHKRIIWGVAWSHDSAYFLTISRDGLCVVWGRREGETEEKGPMGGYTAISTLELKEESLTAIALAPLLLGNQYLVTIGTESGTLYVYTWDPVTNTWAMRSTVAGRHGHQGVINRVQFRPCPGVAGDSSPQENVVQFCTAGGDHFVKIYDVNLDR
uniref:Elongator complex protein 2 n=1 Tax=Cacopsylla melanoneura TaxID=428564 RepID=A0A8D9AMC6_9HEMI